MVSLTSPDNIAYHDDADTYDPPTAYAAIATSVQDALDVRQIQGFQWDDSADRLAQTNMRAGSEGYQADTQITYKYNGSQWLPWHTIQAIAFTPTLTGIVVGTGGSNTAYYTISSGRYTVSGCLIFGTGFTIGNVLGTPNGIAAQMLGAQPVRGICKFVDASPSASYVGTVDQNTGTGATAVRLLVGVASGTYLQESALSSTVPIIWAATDQITYEYSFLPAT